MPRKVMIFAGAPECHTLDWTEQHLLNHFLNPIASFACLDSSIDRADTEVHFDLTPDVPVWRSIPLQRKHLTTGFSQVHDIIGDYAGSPGFFNAIPTLLDTTSTDSDSSQSVLSRFYDHSLAIHDDIPSSQLPAGSSTDTTSFNETTFQDSTTFFSQTSDSAPSQTQPVAIDVGHLSDLEDLPNAAYLQSILPQTITVNLIVGIISVAAPRTVRTRWGSTKTLVELLVGDETKTGFSVTFWLSAESTIADKLLRELRRQDIVLIRNVALSVFSKKVHGHSLRKGITKVDLLHRKRLDQSDQGGLYSMKNVSTVGAAHPQLVKTRKVREWVLNFVSDGGVSLGKRKRGGRPIRNWDMPPEDTQ
jgi:hypothetical protein